MQHTEYGSGYNAKLNKYSKGAIKIFKHLILLRYILHVDTADSESDAIFPFTGLNIGFQMHTSDA